MDFRSTFQRKNADNKRSTLQTKQEKKPTLACISLCGFKCRFFVVIAVLPFFTYILYVKNVHFLGICFISNETTFYSDEYNLTQTKWPTFAHREKYVDIKLIINMIKTKLEYIEWRLAR